VHLQASLNAVRRHDGRKIEFRTGETGNFAAGSQSD